MFWFKYYFITRVRRSKKNSSPQRHREHRGGYLFPGRETTAWEKTCRLRRKVFGVKRNSERLGNPVIERLAKVQKKNKIREELERYERYLG
jgi:hypothetical protein